MAQIRERKCPQFSYAETEVLLHIMRRVEPICNSKWQDIEAESTQLVQTRPVTRPGFHHWLSLSLKQKFMLSVDCKKPMGNSDMPPLVRLAKTDNTEIHVDIMINTGEMGGVRMTRRSWKRLWV